jgi:hypothetical protein
MKKFLLLLIVASCTLTQLKAQEPTFSKGDKVLNLGFGLGSTLYSGFYYKSILPPLSASVDVGIVDNVLEKGVIGIGGYLGYSSYKYEVSGWGWKYSNLIIGGRGTFHYPLVDKLDTYAGLLLGYNISTSKEFGTGSFGNTYHATGGGPVYSAFVGAKYYLQNNLALFGEFGYGISYLTLGVSLKF